MAEAAGTRVPVQEASPDSPPMGDTRRPLTLLEGIREIRRDLSQLPLKLPHFVNRENECEEVMNLLDPKDECRCVFLHGAPGIGKTSLAIKVANEVLETNNRTLVVYVNCKYIVSFDDFAGKIVQQIYHYPLNDPVSAMRKHLRTKDFFTILLLDNFECLIHLKERNQLHEERTKVEDFITNVAMEFGNVKLLVTSSEDRVYPSIGRKLITLEPFKLEETLKLLRKVCEGANQERAKQLTDICGGIPLVLFTLVSSGDALVSCSLSESQFAKYLEMITSFPDKGRINVCLDVCFGRLATEEQDTLIKLALLRGGFTASGAANVFPSTTTSEQFTARVRKLARCSLLQQNKILEDDHWYTFLSVIREYCKRKALEEHSEVLRNARIQFTDHFLAFLKKSFKKFLSRNAETAITEFLREEGNVMQLLEWFESSELMDEERVKKCVDVFNMVGELLAKMMGKTKYKMVYELLKRKCKDMRDQRRLSECLTSLGIKEVFDCLCPPGLCDAASDRARIFLQEAHRIQTELKIDNGNSRAQCLSKLGRCLAKQDETREEAKTMIDEAIRIRLNAVKASDDEEVGKDVCKVMLGATYNDKGVALSLEQDYGPAVKIREQEVLPIYRERLGDHPFTATILSNLSNNYFALREFDKAKQYSEDALKIRLEFLRDHIDTAKSLFDLGMIHKEKREFKHAKTFLERCKIMHENMLDENELDLQRTNQELEDVCRRLDDMQLESQRVTRGSDDETNTE